MSPFSSRRLRADRTAQLFFQSKLPGYIGEHLPLFREESSGRSLGAIFFRQDFLGKEASIYPFSLRRPRAYLPIFFSKDCQTKMASICSPRRLRADRLVPVIPGVAIQAKCWVILLFPSTFCCLPSPLLQIVAPFLLLGAPTDACFLDITFACRATSRQAISTGEPDSAVRTASPHLLTNAHPASAAHGHSLDPEYLHTLLLLGLLHRGAIRIITMPLCRAEVGTKSWSLPHIY